MIPPNTTKFIIHKNYNILDLNKIIIPYCLRYNTLRIIIIMKK